MSSASSLRSLWRRVHPDLFVQHPEARTVNEASMQALNALLEAADDQRSALRGGAAQPKPPHPQQFRFFVHDDAAVSALREVSVDWRPPSSLLAAAQRSSAAHADLWQRSAETCVAALLQQVDPEAQDASASAAFVGSERSDDPLYAGEHAGASSASERRRERGEPSRHPSGEPSEAMPPQPPPGGGQLRSSLLFFHGVSDDAQAVAVERLAALVHAVVPAGVSHGPILLCGRPPPASAAAQGFACVPLDADADALRRHLRLARASTGGVDALRRRAEAEAVLQACRGGIEPSSASQCPSSDLL